MPIGLTERCNCCDHFADVMYCQATREHLCEPCIMALAIAYYEEQREHDEETAKTTPPGAAEPVDEQSGVSAQRLARVSGG